MALTSRLTRAGAQLVVASFALVLVLTGCTSAPREEPAATNKAAMSGNAPTSSAIVNGQKELVVTVPGDSGNGYSLTPDDVRLLTISRMHRAKLGDKVNIDLSGGEVVVRAKGVTDKASITAAITALKTEADPGLRSVLVQKDISHGVGDAVVSAYPGTSKLLQSMIAVPCVDTTTGVREVAPKYQVACSLGMGVEFLVGEVFVKSSDVASWSYTNSSATFTLTPAAAATYLPISSVLEQGGPPDNELALVADNNVVLYPQMSDPSGTDEIKLSFDTTDTPYDVARDEIAFMMAGNSFKAVPRAATAAPTINGDPATPSCGLTDITDVATDAFMAIWDNAMYNSINGNESIAASRCKVPGDAEVLSWYKSHGFKIDGIGQIGSATFYIAKSGSCSVQLAYFSDEKDYSPYKVDYPEKLRFDTPTKALQAGFDKSC
jgi:hypothetical protein